MDFQQSWHVMAQGLSWLRCSQRAYWGRGCWHGGWRPSWGSWGNAQAGFDEETVSHSAPYIFPHVPLYFSVMHLQEVDEAVLVKESDVVVTCLKVARIFYLRKCIMWNWGAICSSCIWSSFPINACRLGKGAGAALWLCCACPKRPLLILQTMESKKSHVAPKLEIVGPGSARAILSDGMDQCSDFELHEEFDKVVGFGTLEGQRSLSKQTSDRPLDRAWKHMKTIWKLLHLFTKHGTKTWALGNIQLPSASQLLNWLNITGMRNWLPLPGACRWHCCGWCNGDRRAGWTRSGWRGLVSL